MSLPSLSAFVPVRLSPSIWPSLREFFAYHGIWAPGVRALRLWSMRVKVLVLMLVMLLPLLPLALLKVQEQNQVVAAGDQQIAGLGIARLIHDLDLAMDQQGQPHEAGKAVPAQVPAAVFADLSLALANNPSPELDRVWQTHGASIERAVNGAAPLAGSGRARDEARNQAQYGLADLRQANVASSGLLLNQGAEFVALAGLAAQHLPALNAELAGLRNLALRQSALLARETRPVTDLFALALMAAGRAEHAERVLAQATRDLAQSPATVRIQGNMAVAAAQALLTQVREQMLRVDPAAETGPLRLAAGGAISESVALQRQTVLAVSDRLAEQRSNALAQRRALFIGLALVLLVAGYLVYSFFLVMHGGLSALNRQMSRMAKGDLSARAVPRGDDEVAMTLQAMTASLIRLSDLLASVRHGIAAITQATQQIALGNTELSSRSRKSSEGLAQTVNRVETYLQQLQSCGQLVESVVGTVQALRLDSTRNRRQMSRLQDKLGELRGKSHEISEIVRMIDGIAFRTNVLALNASVEASKAGESGRGFAVVALEVRSLATRSADSAKRIAEIIGRASSDIEDSVALAQEAGRTIGESDRHVDTIHGAINSVADLTQQGESASSNILAEIKLAQEGTVKNIGLVEQLATASQELRGQGERLSHQVGRFTLS